MVALRKAMIPHLAIAAAGIAVGVVGSLLFFRSEAHASQQPTLAQVKAAFESQTGGRVKAKRTAQSPIAGLYELEFDNGAVGYVDATGRYTLLAPMLDTQAKKVVSQFVNMGDIKPGANIEPNNAPSDGKTSAAVGGIAATMGAAGGGGRVAIDQLFGGIVWKNGNGTRRLVVFSDPECPYCKQLDAVLRDPLQLPDATVEIYPFPLRAQHPKAADYSARIWCQPLELRARAWQDVIDGKEPPAVAVAQLTECAKKVEAIERLGDAWGVTGTPTMFASNGARLSGAANAAELQTFLNTNKE